MWSSLYRATQFSYSPIISWWIDHQISYTYVYTKIDWILDAIPLQIYLDWRINSLLLSINHEAPETVLTIRHTGRIRTPATRFRTSRSVTPILFFFRFQRRIGVRTRGDLTGRRSIFREPCWHTALIFFLFGFRFSDAVERFSKKYADDPGNNFWYKGSVECSVDLM